MVSITKMADARLQIVVLLNKNIFFSFFQIFICKNLMMLVYFYII